MKTDLPIDLAHWALATSPLMIVALVLVWLRRSAAVAGAVGAGASLVIAAGAFRADLQVLWVASGKGLWDALFVLYVVWPALLLYLIADRAGAFEALRRGLRHFSRNELFQVLAFGWVFASFLQGISGFGTPIAVVAPLLLAIGVRPLYAVVIPLIGHAWATMFGSIAVTWLATQRVVDLTEVTTTAWQTALLLWISDALAGAAIAWLFGRRAALLAAVPFILTITVIHGGVQLGLVLWQPVISNFIAGSIALVALYPLSRWRRYREPAEDSEDRPAMREEADSDEGEKSESEPPPMGLGMALFPYAVLTAVAVVILLTPGVENALERFEIGLPFPQTATGYGISREVKNAYSPIAPLTHPGFFLLIACAATLIVYGAKGYLGSQKPGEGFLRELRGKAVPASAAIAAFLVMSKILSHSGQIREIALGISQVVPSTAYAAAAPFIGALGAFVTSSSTASNLLFAPLQATVAETEGLPKPTIIAAQSAGGALGNAIAPANVVLGASTAGLLGREGEILRKALPWILVAAVLTGAATVILTVLE